MNVYIFSSTVVILLLNYVNRFECLNGWTYVSIHFYWGYCNNREALTSGAPGFRANATGRHGRKFRRLTVIEVNLKAVEKELVKRLLPFNVLFTATRTVANDHAVLAALRDLARQVYEKSFSIMRTAERTLVVGAGMREISKYANNPNICHYVYMGEAKDHDRIIRPALNAIAARLKLKAAKTDKRVFLPHPDKIEGAPLRPAAKRYFDAAKVLDDYMTSHQLPPVISLEPKEANTLLFEDTIYNFDKASLVKLFNDTGANLWYGYALLPMELLFPDMPSNRIYLYSREGDYARLTFRGGISNRYQHRHDIWSLLLRNPVIRYKGTTLVVEVVCRMGPMSVFKIMRTTQPESIVRTIGLTEQETYVRILNVEDMYDYKNDTLRRPLQYISVREEEFYNALNYMLSIDEKSRTLTNCVSYVRRRMGGMSLVTKELLAPWDLAKKDTMNFCIVVVLYCNMKMILTQFTDPDNYNFQGLFASLRAKLCDMVERTIENQSKFLHMLIYKARLEDQLLLTPQNEIVQVGEVKKRVHWKNTEGMPQKMRDAMFGVPRGEVPTSLYLDFPNEEDLPSCDVCLSLHNRLGDQIVSCGSVDTSYHTFSLSERQFSQMKTDLLDNDNDAPGLMKVKDRAVKSLPSGPFLHRAKVHYIKAGPGCGKSYIIRELADEDDLIIAPFTKLKSDYERLVGPDGQMYDLNFKTTHRALETKGYRRIFFDEFTSFSYDILATVVYNNAAEEVFLVGDVNQTGVREPDEGLYICNYLDVSLLDTHELLVNFRNPPDTVALLNKLFGYQMRAHKPYDGQPSVVIVEDVAEVPETETALRMCFTKEVARRITENEKNTVRSNEGGTYRDAVLFVNAADGELTQMSCMQIVALTRHTSRLFIIVDSSEVGQRFKTFVDQGPEWASDFKNYLQFPDVDVKKYETSHEVVRRVLQGTDDTGPPSSSSDEALTVFCLVIKEIIFSRSDQL